MLEEFLRNSAYDPRGHLRFARDRIVQDHLKGLGNPLIAVDEPGSFKNETRTAVVVRQIVGAASQFPRAELVSLSPNWPAPGIAHAVTARITVRAVRPPGAATAQERAEPAFSSKLAAAGYLS